MTTQLSLLTPAEADTTGPARLRACIAARLSQRDEAMRRARIHATPDQYAHPSDPFFIRENVRVARTRNHMALRDTRALRRMEATR